VTTPSHSNGSYSRIFRANAIRSYIAGREETVFPRFVSPRVFIYLWILMALLLSMVMVAWYIKYPIYDSAMAIATGDNSSQAAARVKLVVLLPPTMQIDGPLILTSAQGRLNTTVLQLSSQAVSPKEFRERFALDPAVELLVSQPVKVAVIEAENPGLPADLYNGGFFQVNVQTGSQRVISMVPVIGKYFKG
jgi:hypothetical protein